jgi:hypothetical protein
VHELLTTASLVGGREDGTHGDGHERTQYGAPHRGQALRRLLRDDAAFALPDVYHEDTKGFWDEARRLKLKLWSVFGPTPLIISKRRDKRSAFRFEDHPPGSGPNYHP